MGDLHALTSDKRSRLIGAAVEVIHHQGLDKTTLADIAKKAKVPLGNVFYYFKTKAQLAEAVIQRRQEQFTAMRQQWEQLPGAKEQLLSYVDMTVASRDVVARWGCPVGTLCSELQKGSGPLGKKAAELFTQILAWMEERFRALDQPEPQALALQLLSSLQGVSVLAHTLHDPKLLEREAGRIRSWIREL